MYDLRDYWRQGDDLNAAFGRLHKAILEDINAAEAKRQEKAALKAEIIAALKPEIEKIISVKFDNAASPELEKLKNQIDSLFKP